MAGSLQRPPFKIIPTYNECSSTSKYKLIIKYRKQRPLRSKGSQDNCTAINTNTTSGNKSASSLYQNPQQLHQLVKQLKYCQSLSLDRLLLLLSTFSNDSCWTATENKKHHKNLITITTTNYVQQHKQQQQLQLQLQLLQILRKVFKSSKFRKNLLNRKKLQQLQLREIQFYKKNQLYEKSF